MTSKQRKTLKKVKQLTQAVDKLIRKLKRGAK